VSPYIGATDIGSVVMTFRRGVYRVLLVKPEGKRPLGRPRHRTVPVGCLVGRYICFMLFEIINNLCECAEGICSAYVADSIQSS